jgi:integrase
MPVATEIERRDRAVVAFIMLTGARDGAIVSLKIKHVDLTEGKVVFDAREVKTKFAKSFTTTFFRVGDEVHQIVAEWVDYPSSCAHVYYFASDLRGMGSVADQRQSIRRRRLQTRRWWRACSDL